MIRLFRKVASRRSDKEERPGRCYLSKSLKLIDPESRFYRTSMYVSSAPAIVRSGKYLLPQKGLGHAHRAHYRRYIRACSQRYLV